MPQLPRPDGWIAYSHHRLATIEEWDSGATVRNTLADDSQYNPHLFGSDEQVQALELECMTHGVRIRDTANKETRYLAMDAIVGACSGVYTKYVFAECTSGFYHGRPVSPQALARLGVKVS